MLRVLLGGSSFGGQMPSDNTRSSFFRQTIDPNPGVVSPVFKRAEETIKAPLTGDEYRKRYDPANSYSEAVNLGHTAELIGLKSFAIFALKHSKSLLKAAKTSTNAFKHSFKYADRVRMRAVQDPVSHNFPYSFDGAILSTSPILKNNGYKIFQLAGTMNGKNGVFEIGLTKGGIIDNRFFRPIK